MEKEKENYEMIIFMSVQFIIIMKKKMIKMIIYSMEKMVRVVKIIWMFIIIIMFMHMEEFKILIITKKELKIVLIINLKYIYKMTFIRIILLFDEK